VPTTMPVPPVWANTLPEFNVRIATARKNTTSTKRQTNPEGTTVYSSHIPLVELGAPHPGALGMALLPRSFSLQRLTPNPSAASLNPPGILRYLLTSYSKAAAFASIRWNRLLIPPRANSNTRCAGRWDDDHHEHWQRRQNLLQKGGCPFYNVWVPGGRAI
jgi:hypothetical protein